MLQAGAIANVLEYYFNEPSHQSEIERSVRDFFDVVDEAPTGTEASIGFYNEWFLYDFDLHGYRSALEHFVRNNPRNLGPAELSVYEDLLDNRFGLFEVLEVQPLVGATLRLLATGETFHIKEFSGTMDMEVGDGIFSRVATVDSQYELVGANSFSVPLQDPEFKPYLDTLLQKKTLTPKDVHLMLLTGTIA